MPWFIQLIMAIFMIILYLLYLWECILVPVIQINEYCIVLEQERIVHFYCYFGYYNIVFIVQSSIGELQNYLNNSKTI